MKKELSLIEIKNDKPIREWATKLMGDFKADALESIKREGVTEESVFYMKIDNKEYLAFYMEGEMLPADPTMDVNRKHREVMQAIKKRRIDGELLYTLSRNDN